MRDAEAGQASFRFSAQAGRAFVANLAARAGRGAWKWRDRRRVIMRLDFHEDVDRFILEFELATCGMRRQPFAAESFHHRRVIRIRGDHAARTRLRRTPDHAEQLVGLPLAIDEPVGIEYLVAAMFRIRLCEHHQLGIGRIASERTVIVDEVVDLVARQCQSQFTIRPH